MAREMLMMVWCVHTMALLKPTDSAPQVIITPDTIEVDLTRSLEVNCTFTSENPTNISNLISLIVKKSDDDNDNTPDFQELASINQFTPDQVKTITPVNASVSGHISTGGVSYLSLQWAYPNAGVAGTYRCSALGMDTLGHPVEEHHTKQVTASTPNMNQLIEMLKLQQIQMDNMMRVLANVNMRLDSVSTLTHDVSTLTNNFSTFNNNVNTFMANFSTLTNDVSTLTNEVSTLNSDLTHLNKTVSDEMKNTNKYQDILSASLTNFYINSSDYQGRHYLLSEEDHGTYGEAQASCLLQGGYLAEINDVNEHNFIKKFLNSAAATQYKDYVLIGATQIEHPGTWVFGHSHRVVNYKVWGPHILGNSFTCMYLERVNHWSMDDNLCSVSGDGHTFLCEIPNL